MASAYSKIERMKFAEKISLKLATNIILILLLANLIFQTLVMIGVVPFDMVWGGRLESKEEMARTVPIGMLVMVLIGLIVALKAAYIKNGISDKILNALLWLCGLLFILNTLGNIASTSSLEALIFTPMSILLAVMVFVLSTKRKPLETEEGA